MSKRAEKAAWDWAVKNKLDPYSMGQAYGQGYEQAEKDTIERACDMLMNYVFEEVTPEMRDHFRKAMEKE